MVTLTYWFVKKNKMKSTTGESESPYEANKGDVENF